MQKKTTNEYDQIKGMLSTIRKYTTPSYGSLKEQTEPTGQPTPQPQPGQPQQQMNTVGGEKKDFNVINNVEVDINSTDKDDTILKDDEKGKISQLIDDFRKEVSELTNFGKLQIYGNSGKLDGTINNLNIGFTLSAGDDEGVFLSNSSSMLKLSDEVMDMLNKLKIFQGKFAEVINGLLVTRKDN
jgi:hypothetical protein